MGGDANFQSSRGAAMLELKCVDGLSSAPKLRFSIAVGNGAPRGPVGHDFSKSSVAGLPESEVPAEVLILSEGMLPLGLCRRQELVKGHCLAESLLGSALF